VPKSSYGFFETAQRTKSAEEKMSKFLDNPYVHSYDGTSPINSSSPAPHLRALL
jgi:hypothetical protein